MALVKPTVGQTAWGTTLNTALDYLDTTKAPIASPTFTGTVSLGVATATTINGTTIPSSVTLSTSANTVLRDVNNNTSINNISFGTTSTATNAATPLVLTVASSAIQNFTGSANQDVQLPNATTLTVGAIYYFNNASTGQVFLKNAGGTTLYTVPSGGATQVTLLTNSIANGTWQQSAFIPNNVNWGTASISATSTAANFYSVSAPTFFVTSYQRYAVANVTTPVTASTFTVPETDTFVIFNSASAIAVTLPTASSYPGRVLNVKTINTGAVTSASSNVVALATTTAAATIFSANTAGKWTTLVSNGTNWVIMAQN
jgi:hypothetical protein